MMKIAVDAFGGDTSPYSQIKGGIDFLNETKDVGLVFTGDKEILKRELSKYKYDSSRVFIEHAPEVISNEEAPTTAIRAKKDSSMVKAFDLLKEDAEVAGMISSGSTGAVLTGSVLKVGRINGVLRPALAPLLPTRGGGRVCLIDCGANVDSRPDFLVQFTLMAVCYMRSVYGIQNPRVGLVSVGVEDHKGNALTKEVFEQLKKLPINFKGNMEARDALTGEYDILVADGFVGNVLLKSVEGTAQMVMGELKSAIMASASAKFGALFMKKAFRKLKKSMDYNAYGGAPFLGINKVVVKAHGAANPEAVSAALRQVKKMIDADLAGGIKEELEKFSVNE
ncbi:phosphate acyltransferase PlsX [Pumilibacter intestinalis]|uniref:phosphate acyltransferase PlsX n=1 Tax=Pumilibacter intestinalis TaxID=2941511 RepID=UPI002040A8B4|nr:phosphate acyltransferase PlsX [Pumilibacter intestinalis]